MSSSLKGLTRPKELFYTIKKLPPNVEPTPEAGIGHVSDRPFLASQGEEIDECNEEVNPLDEKIQYWLDQGQRLMKTRRYSTRKVSVYSPLPLV